MVVARWGGRRWQGEVGEGVKGTNLRYKITKSWGEKECKGETNIMNTRNLNIKTTVDQRIVSFFRVCILILRFLKVGIKGIKGLPSYLGFVTD